MIKILDIPGALSALRYPAGMMVELDFSIANDFLVENNGSYRLEVAGGEARCSAGGDGHRVLTPQGLALLFAGAQSCANVRAVGHLSGGDVDQDLAWDAPLRWPSAAHPRLLLSGLSSAGSGVAAQLDAHGLPLTTTRLQLCVAVRLACQRSLTEVEFE